MVPRLAFALFLSCGSAAAASGTKALYVRKGNEDYYWKRYKGGQYPDAWMADFAAKTFEPVTDYPKK